MTNAALGEDSRLSDAKAHDLTVRALDNGVICASRIPELLHEWREPRHEAFRPRTVWSWFNAATEILKGRLDRLRDELWWACREWFREKGCRIDPAVNTPAPVTLENLGSALLGELTQVRYAITSSGKVQIESKDDMKKRGLASPNLADALCLTFAAGPATPFENSAPRQIVVNRNVAW